MNRLLLSLIFLSGYLFDAVAQENALTTIILVRHAEKQNDGTRDPDLSTAGVERSEKLAELFSRADIHGVYSTGYKRTQNTVRPLAETRALKIQSYDKIDKVHLDGLVKSNKGKTVVMAGHSNTVPAIANVLLGKSIYQDFADDEYGNVFIISLTAPGENASIVRLSY